MSSEIDRSIDPSLTSPEQHHSETSLLNQVDSALQSDERLFIAGRVSVFSIQSDILLTNIINVAPKDPTFEIAEYQEFAGSLLPEMSPRYRWLPAANRGCVPTIGQIIFQEPLGVMIQTETTEIHLQEGDIPSIEEEAFQAAGFSREIDNKLVLSHSKETIPKKNVAVHIWPHVDMATESQEALLWLEDVKKGKKEPKYSPYFDMFIPVNRLKTLYDMERGGSQESRSLTSRVADVFRR